MNDANESFESLSNDLCIISNWANQKKMSFYPDRSKQPQSHIVLTFDNSPVIKPTHHKHLRLILDEKLNFKEKNCIKFILKTKLL